MMGCNHGCTAADFAAVGGYTEFLPSCDDIDISLKMRALGLPAAFAEGAVVHYRYRREPMQAVRQVWGYGKGSGRICDIYSIEPLTFLDVIVACYRGVKQFVRLRLSGRRPVRPAADIADAVASATVLWRNPAFWHLGFRSTVVANPLLVQLDRLRRLARLARRRANAVRDRA